MCVCVYPTAHHTVVQLVRQINKELPAGGMLGMPVDDETVNKNLPLLLLLLMLFLFLLMKIGGFISHYW